MKENKTRECQLKAARKWRKENCYFKTITFYKKDFPKERFEMAKKKIKEKGMSENEFFTVKLKELIGDE